MSKKIRLIVLAFIWIVIMPLQVACSVHYGSPQAVWFWCDMAALCQR